MKIPSYRTFARPLTDLNDHVDEAAWIKEHFRPKQLLRKLVDNPEYESFKSLNRRAAGGQVRMHFMFPEETPDKIVLSMADRKNPTPMDVFNFFANKFRTKGKVKPLPTMNNQEFVQFFKDAFKFAVKPGVVNKAPVKTVEFDPSKPFMEEVRNALRELANERLFGVPKK